MTSTQAVSWLFCCVHLVCLIMVLAGIDTPDLPWYRYEDDTDEHSVRHTVSGFSLSLEL